MSSGILQLYITPGSPYGNPVFDPPAGDQAWEARRLEALARSMMDGLAVWGRG